VRYVHKEDFIDVGKLPRKISAFMLELVVEEATRELPSYKLIRRPLRHRFLRLANGTVVKEEVECELIVRENRKEKLLRIIPYTHTEIEFRIKLEADREYKTLMIETYGFDAYGWDKIGTNHNKFKEHEKDFIELLNKIYTKVDKLK
jgi:hypothetical protein